MSDDELFAILSEIADEEIMAKNRASIIEVGRRIISLAANGAEPVVWFGGNNYCTTNREIAERFNLRPAYATPVASGPCYDWSVSGMKQSETGNWVMAGEADSAMAKDAERYRWLRDKANSMGHVKRAPLVLMTRDDCSNNGWEDVLTGEALDDSIDRYSAASAEKGEPK